MLPSSLDMRSRGKLMLRLSVFSLSSQAKATRALSDQGPRFESTGLHTLRKSTNQCNIGTIGIAKARQRLAPAMTRRTHDAV